MIIGHLPAGYLLSTVLSKKWGITNECLHKHFLLAGMIGSIFPDIDMLYFYLIDNRQHHHHSFFTHYPIVWAVLIIISYLYVKSSCCKSLGLLALTFSLNGFGHMILDSIVADIQWLAPFSHQCFSLFHVPARYSSVLFNFIFHWSFLIELLLVAMAIFAYRNRRLKMLKFKRHRDAFFIAA